MKRRGAKPSSTQRMPLRGQTCTAQMDCSLVENKPIRVAKNAHEVSRKLTENLYILNALAFPRDAGNIHRVLWRTTTQAQRRRPRDAPIATAWLDGVNIITKSLRCYLNLSEIVSQAALVRPAKSKTIRLDALITGGLDTV